MRDRSASDSERLELLAEDHAILAAGDESDEPIGMQ
jgi:hypothetical protein